MLCSGNTAETGRCVWIDRGTGRQLLPDYRPDAILSTLDQVVPLFKSLGW
jgi:2-haloacid dehalogenase